MLFYETLGIIQFSCHNLYVVMRFETDFSSYSLLTRNQNITWTEDRCSYLAYYFGKNISVRFQQCSGQYDIQNKSS